MDSLYPEVEKMRFVGEFVEVLLSNHKTEKFHKEEIVHVNSGGLGIRAVYAEEIEIGDKLV